jgi:hypothetical protein
MLPGPLGWAVDELRHHQATAILQAAAAVGRFRSDDWVRRIDVPVAVVASTHDRVVPLARQARLALSIPTAVLHPAESGHLEIGSRRSGEMVQTICKACGEVADRAERWPAHPALPGVDPLARTSPGVYGPGRRSSRGRRRRHV